MRHGFRWAAQVSIIFAAAVATVSCDAGRAAPDVDDVSDFFSGVTTANNSISATLRAGDVPAAGSGPVAVVNGSAAMILGGSALRTVTSATPFSTLIVSVAGYPGYWELNLPASVTSQDIILSLTQIVVEPDFTVQYNARAGTTMGTADAEPVTIITVGTGPVQVSISWDTETDVDLHLVEPGGEEIYWAHGTSASGGELDLDSNAGCAIDGKKNENITWPTGSPPRGTYIVRVDYWSSCSIVGTTNFVVTVRVEGRAPVTYTGQLTGVGDNGGQGSGIQVATFVY